MGTITQVNVPTTIQYSVDGGTNWSVSQTFTPTALVPLASETFTFTAPWNLAAIKEALKSGDIHSLYQIEADGRQQPLRDFLEALESSGCATAKEGWAPHQRPGTTPGQEGLPPRATTAKP